MFWNKKNDHWEGMLKVVELMKVNLVELAKRIDMIEEKLRSPIIKKNLKEKEEDKEENSSNFNDGFDELRQLRKDLSINFYK